MTGDRPAGEPDDELDALATHIRAAHGDLLAVDVPGAEYSDLIGRLQWLSIDDDEVDVRMVFGAACTTAARAIDQFAAALQLPYVATRGWWDFIDQLGERGASSRCYIIVADAARLLVHEDPDLWRDLVLYLHGGPFCMGGGWTTLVLADTDFGWESSPFGSAKAAQTAATSRSR